MVWAGKGSALFAADATACALLAIVAKAVCETARLRNGKFRRPSLLHSWPVLGPAILKHNNHVFNINHEFIVLFLKDKL